MKNHILCMVAMVALAACVPAPQDRGPASEVRGNEFSIEPEGTWLPNCQDSRATVSGVVAYQRRIVFAEEEPTFSLRDDFLSQSCKESKPAVVLRKYLKGKITLGEHSNLDDGRRVRAAEVEVSTESFKPETDAGLNYLKDIVSTEMASQLSIGKEFVIPKDHMQYGKLHGMLVIKKDARNAMHVYLDPQQKTAKSIVSQLDDSNLYVRHITK